MSFGIAIIDQLVKKHGISALSCDNEFQHTQHCYGGETPSIEWGQLPFCINRFLFQAPLYSQWTLHCFSLPKTGKPLACFILDVSGKVVERVYFQNTRKYYDACDKLAAQLTSMTKADKQAA
ncbi:hypothetical protein QTP81_07630 [Alteromonas sp. ASW11-36]|uniref:Alkyl hydroperoxide reductase subunit C/ Thiol specific antioxidant domain-containing protein n=1 Tax=Alteromonas arenosi TaxID=3055817 RepID=A0ABT7SWC5_9ALTE|nr:hypothetical protein [Alteromonas sp. ASW11-36]MDM7860463.1 hypothetical protein [Alteromonas sp. ASW11-36]